MSVICPLSLKRLPFTFLAECLERRKTKYERRRYTVSSANVSWRGNGDMELRERASMYRLILLFLSVRLFLFYCKEVNSRLVIREIPVQYIQGDIIL